MSGPPSRRKKIIVIIIITGRLTIADTGEYYSTAFNLSCAALPQIDDEGVSANIGDAVDTFANIVGDPDSPNAFTQAQVENYINAMAMYIQG